MTRILLSLFLLVFASEVYTQTTLSGKVTDEETGEPISFGNVALYRNGILITGDVTDVDGNYSLSSLDPGTYELLVSYTGYQPRRITGVQLLAGKATRLDVEISTGGGVILDEVVVVDYKVPLIEQDNTTSGAVITGDQIKNLPTRNINALAALTAGMASADEGDALNVRGSRSNATDYYVDGIRVFGNLIPESEIDQLQVITGGVEAQYGDVTGGIISITTKGPSSQFTGGIELESSQFLDPYNNSLIGFNLSGPIWKRPTGQPILGFRIAGRYTYREDDDPPGVRVFRVRDDVLSRLEEDPILDIGGNPFVAADFLTQGDVEARDAKPFENFERFDLTGKLDLRLSPAIDMSFTGTFTDSENRFTPAESWRVYNSHQNPFGFGNTYRGNFRFRHRLGKQFSPYDRSGT
ncbi:MAG: TonB-dependent receptor, partial [Saprospiraceae bacterium]|nr:TonB-dependent receptor [Saprospiraceae bacterium]